MRLTRLNNLWPPFGRRITGEPVRLRPVSAKPAFGFRNEQASRIKLHLSRATISPRSEGGG